MDTVHIAEENLFFYNGNIDPDYNCLNSYTANSSYYTLQQFIDNVHKSKDLSIIHINCRSLNANFADLKILLETLDFSFDVIGLTETWLNESNADVFQLEGYDFYHKNRVTKHGGGVAFFIKSIINYTIIEQLTVDVEDVFECLTVKLLLKTQTIVSCLYRKPSSKIADFMECIESMFSCIKGSIYICGDFNIDLLSYNVNNNTRQFVDQMSSMSLFPLINQPTRITNQCHSIIDNIYTNSINEDIVSGVIIADISDHFPIFSILQKDIHKKETEQLFYLRANSEENICKLNCLLALESWHLVFGANNVNDSYNAFIDIFMRYYNHCCPMKEHKCKKHHKVWITNSLTDACKKKNKLYVAFKKNPTFQNECKYKKYKNKLTNVLRICEETYYSNKLDKVKADNKETWQVLNEILNRKKRSICNQPENYYDSKNIYTTPKDIANGFSRYFADIGPSLSSKIPVGKGNIYDHMQTMIIDSIFLIGIAEFEVLKTVKNFKNKKSNDPHGLSMEILKQVIPNIVKPLTYICNKSFLEGCFPDSMKISRIVPIFKAGDKNTLDNYRPISILPQFSKVLEKLFQNRLLNFVEKNNVLNDNQYGFRRNRSTTIALFDLSQKVSTFLENKLSALGIFVDLRKAFDTIDHGILLKKIEYMGVRGIALKWVASYLNNRKQYVSFLSENSSNADVVCGVPQGSILGPLFFILYINDICNVSNYFTFTLFADDTTIVSAHHDIDILFSQANIELTKLYNWFCLNKLSLNIDKTSYILFSNKQDDPKNTINIDNINIKRVFSNNFLGVTIDHKLSWKTQIADVCKKVSRCTGIYYKVKSILSTKILNSLYSSLVEPHFTYCVEVWGNTYRSYLQSLYRKQKRAIRIVCKSSYLCHSADLFKKLEVLSLFHLVKYKTAIFMYKVFYGLVPANILSHFTHISNIYSTRQYKNLYVYYARTKHKQMCVEHMGVSIWNSIEIETRNCMNLKLFKVKYKKSLLTQI